MKIEVFVLPFKLSQRERELAEKYIGDSIEVETKEMLQKGDVICFEPSEFTDDKEFIEAFASFGGYARFVVSFRSFDLSRGDNVFTKKTSGDYFLDELCCSAEVYTEKGFWEAVKTGQI